MSHIFISYSRKDFYFAQKIVEALAVNKLDTWADWKNIPPSVGWEDEIYRGIEDADAFLFLVSPDSVRSKMCNAEIAHAVRNGKRIVTILIRDTDPASIPPDVSKIQWIQCRDGQADFDTAIEEIRTTIHTDYEWLKFHTELQVKALKWEQKKDASRLLRGKELQEAEQQLADVGGSKGPPLTDLQSQFLLASRKYEESTQSIAEQNRRLIISRQLSTQGQSIIFEQKTLADNDHLLVKDEKYLSGIECGILLAIESIKSYPTFEGDQALRSGLNILAQILGWTQRGRDLLFKNIEKSPADLNDVYKKVSLHSEYIQDLCFSPNGRYMATASKDCSAIVWDIKSEKAVLKNNFDSPVRTAVFSPGGKYVAFASQDHSAKVLSVNKGIEHLVIIHDGPVGPIAFHPDEKVLATGSADCTIRIYNIKTKKEVNRLNQKEPIYQIAFSLDGNWLATCNEGDEGILYSVNSSSFNAVDTFKHHWTQKLFFTPDNKKLVTSFGNTVNIKNLSTREESSIRYTELIRICNISHHGDWIAVDDQNGIKISDLDTGNTILDNAVEYSSSACFSPDNQWVAISDSSTVTFFETLSWSKLMRIKSPESFTNIEFSHDSSWLATWGHYEPDRINYGKYKHPVDLWIWRWDDLLAEASKRVRRNLSREEWKRYFPNEPYRPTFSEWPAGQ